MASWESKLAERALQGGGIGAYLGTPATAGIGAAIGAGVGLAELGIDAIGNYRTRSALEGMGPMDDPLSARLIAGQQKQLSALQSGQKRLMQGREDALRDIQQGAVLPGAQAVAATGASGLQAGGAKQAQAQQAAALAGRQYVQAQQAFDRDLMNIAQKIGAMETGFAQQSIDVANAIARNAQLAAPGSPDTVRAIIQARARGMQGVDPDLAAALESIAATIA